MQIYSPTSIPSFFTTRDKAMWAAVRKGCAPAFSPENMRKTFPAVRWAAWLMRWRGCIMLFGLLLCGACWVLQARVNGQHCRGPATLLCHLQHLVSLPPNLASPAWHRSHRDAAPAVCPL